MEKNSFKFANIIWGIAFIGVGVIFAGNSLHFWDIDLFFRGWWTLFIIIPCLVSIIQNGFQTGPLIGLAIGILLLLNQQGILAHVNLWSLMLPVCLIVIGFSMLLHTATKPRIPENVAEAYSSSGKRTSYSAVFSSRTVSADQEVFEGASLSATFGAVTLDLRTAIIQHDVIIESNTVFGGIDIYLPSNVKVKIDDTPIFGGVDKHHVDAADPSAPTVYIKGTCVFGGIEIKC